MTTITRVLAAALALGGAMTISGCANAHDWHGPGHGYAQPHGGGWNGAGPSRAGFNHHVVETTCSGQRGFTLERNLRVQMNRGLIDGWTGQRIQNAINRLQWRERHECREGDYRAASRIGREYTRIGQWIDKSAAHTAWKR
jgi:hypothetical protein